MPKKLTNKERDNLIVELHNLQTSMNASGILGGSPRTLAQLEQRRLEIQSLLQNEHVPAARKRKADDEDFDGGKKRRPMVKKMSDVDIREEIGMIERTLPPTRNSRLMALREEMKRRQQQSAGAGAGAGASAGRGDPEFYEVVDDDDAVVVIDDDDDLPSAPVQVGAGESFGPIVVEIERRQDESPLVYL